MAFVSLSCPLKENKESRKAGFELEFAGLSPETAAKIVQQLYGGDVQKTNRFSFTCKTAVGAFDCVLDAQMLRELKFRTFFKELGLDLEKLDQEEVVERVIEKGARLFVPCEITTPPLKEEEFEKLEELAAALVQAGAKGTSHTFHYAFGLHINLEVPNKELKTLLSYLRAYFLLESYLYQISRIDLARRLSKFIDPFPPEYKALILNPAYAPASTKALMETYVAYNPTRNRSLDMTPLFATLDEEFMRASLEEPALLKPRPALHYRLPNCSLGEEGWGVGVEWNRFVLVEILAHDASASQLLLEHYAKKANRGTRGKQEYEERVEAWVRSLALA